MKHITREGLKKMIDNKEDFVLLNVLSQESFQKKHIPGSLNVPWREIPLADKGGKIHKGKAVVVYCGSFECDASAKAGEFLEILGYKVIEYDGGMDDWEEAGYTTHSDQGIKCDCDQAKLKLFMDKKLTEVKEFRVKLYPKDFEKVRSFYEKNLRFTVVHEWNTGKNEKGVMFNVGGTILELLSPKEGYKPIAGSSFSLEVNDVHVLWKTMKNGKNIVFLIRDNAWGDTSFCISDPEGFKITFFTRHKNL